MTFADVEFFFDPVSPYAWLAMEQVDRITKAGGRIVCRPILFAALLNAHITKGPAEVPAKRAYVFRDVMREAVRLQLPFRGPPFHPFNPLAALRAVHAIDTDAQRLAFSRDLLSAVWADGLDLADDEILHALLARRGIDADAVRVASETADIKQRLRSTTQDAIEGGVFGVPTFRLRNELFWGADRMDAVAWSLQGGGIDEAAYADVLNRPTAAER